MLKKILIGFGSLTAIATPAALAISCDTNFHDAFDTRPLEIQLGGKLQEAFDDDNSGRGDIARDGDNNIRIDFKASVYETNEMIRFLGDGKTIEDLDDVLIQIESRMRDLYGIVCDSDNKPVAGTPTPQGFENISLGLYASIPNGPDDHVEMSIYTNWKDVDETTYYSHQPSPTTQRRIDQILELKSKL